MQDYAKLLRHCILTSTTEAGSGHVTSSLSAVELTAALFYSGIFKYFTDQPHHPNNDRFILSKGHAAPLLYSLWAVAGAIPMDELKTLRKFKSRLEGHPTLEFPYVDVATGSLGQGLSIGVGMALNAKFLDRLPYKTYVLLGDSEMAEGSNWEAMQLAAYYKLNNLIGIIDVNRLGQRGETMYGHDLSAYAERVQAFGWHTISVEGHSLPEITKAYQSILDNQTRQDRPTMIIAHTIKGKGISFLEDKNGWHGKALSQSELAKALEELGSIDLTIRAEITKPEDLKPAVYNPLEDGDDTDQASFEPGPEPDRESEPKLEQEQNQPMSTRKAYGDSLVTMHPDYPNMVVLDAEVSNSTYAAEFKEAYPERFFEMFIAEQNMIGVAVGLSACGKIPFVSTFASFFTRAVDQIRVAQYSKANLNCVGSHVGVSIGEDGPTQMGLEDIAILRAILGSVVLYPADHVAEEKLVRHMADHKGICYMRTTRMDTDALYEDTEDFPIGGSKTLKSSLKDVISIVTAGITLYEALKAYDILVKENISVRIIDLYSIKPIDTKTLQQAAQETKTILTVEDHFADGGLGDAVCQALSNRPHRIYSLAVTKMPRSGKPQELLDYEEISAEHIVKKVKEVLKNM